MVYNSVYIEDNFNKFFRLLIKVLTGGLYLPANNLPVDRGGFAG